MGGVGEGFEEEVRREKCRELKMKVKINTEEYNNRKKARKREHSIITIISCFASTLIIKHFNIVFLTHPLRSAVGD